MARVKKLGLALGSGGARGVAHVGVLKALEEAGIKVDMICGVSMGAAVGALFATGMSVAEIEKVAVNMRKRDMAKLIDLTRLNHSLIKGKKIYKLLEILLNGYSFADTQIPLRIVATDLENGNEVTIRQGSLVEAVQASIAVPGIFPPVQIGERFLIDGGVVNPTPIDIVSKMGADIVVGVDLVMNQSKKFTKPNMIQTLMQSYEIIRTQAVKFKLENTQTNAILIKPSVGRAINSFKFHDVPRFIRAGELAAKKVIPEIIKQLNK